MRRLGNFLAGRSSLLRCQFVEFVHLARPDVRQSIVEAGTRAGVSSPAPTPRVARLANCAACGSAIRPNLTGTARRKTSSGAGFNTIFANLASGGAAFYPNSHALPSVVRDITDPVARGIDLAHERGLAVDAKQIVTFMYKAPPGVPTPTSGRQPRDARAGRPSDPAIGLHLAVSVAVTANRELDRVVGDRDGEEVSRGRRAVRLHPLLRTAMVFLRELPARIRTAVSARESEATGRQPCWRERTPRNSTNGGSTKSMIGYKTLRRGRAWPGQVSPSQRPCSRISIVHGKKRHRTGSCGSTAVTWIMCAR